MTKTTDHQPIFHAWRAWPCRVAGLHAAVLCVILLIAGCGVGPLITVELSGDNLDQGRLEMALALDGHPAAKTEILPPGQRRFTLRLPAHATGKLLVQVQRFMDGDACAIYEGQNAPLVVTGDATVQVKLEKQLFRPCPAPESKVNRVFGFGSSDVWFAGDKGKLLHWDGKAIAEVLSGTTSCLRGLWGPSPDRLWIVGCDGLATRREGTTLRSYGPLDGSPELTSVHGISDSLAWAVGTKGAIARWAGSRWTKEDSGQIADLWGVFAISATDIWAVGSGIVLHSDGSKWTSVLSMSGVNFISLWASGPNDVWVGGTDGILRHSTNGTSFTTVDPMIGRTSISDLWGNGKGQIWGGVKGGQVLYQDPQRTWNVAKVPNYEDADFASVWANSTNDLWVVGGYNDDTGGLILHLLPNPG